MFTVTVKEIRKAFRTLPQNQPMTHDDLLWYVKDFYHGKGFVKMDSIHYALAKNKKMFNHATINGEKKFWISEKIG